MMNAGNLSLTQVIALNWNNLILSYVNCNSLTVVFIN